MSDETMSIRTESLTPSAYRLKRSIEDGELILQGCFVWSNGTDSGYGWRDLPTIEE
jgi:hypothetical protein